MPSRVLFAALLKWSFLVVTAGKPACKGIAGCLKLCGDIKSEGEKNDTSTDTHDGFTRRVTYWSGNKLRQGQGVVLPALAPHSRCDPVPVDKESEKGGWDQPDGG